MNKSLDEDVIHRPQYCAAVALKGLKPVPFYSTIMQFTG
ncbi:hypothetical protein RHI9324_04159 [Rhizobium sp. CECT 9324]|nr:hypothetical protein RHI9324_04159 [Rhizobium sp. CECT 9324]